MPTLTSITRYPLKSGRGEPLDRAQVEPWGLAGDRRWMVVEADGTMVTGRRHPRLVLVDARLELGGLALSAPGTSTVRVRQPCGADRIEVDVFGDRFPASPVTGGEDWLSAWLDAPVRLVYLDDPTVRAADQDYALPGDVVSLADGYPVLVTAAASLAALNGWIADGPRAGEGPVPMGRFRPNFVVTGGEPWAEDRWRRVRIGESTFRAVKGCGRCIFTLVDPATAARTKEPLSSLARHRRWGGESWFGVNLVPDAPWGEVVVGDPVEVLEQAPTSR